MGTTNHIKRRTMEDLKFERGSNIGKGNGMVSDKIARNEFEWNSHSSNKRRGRPKIT